MFSTGFDCRKYSVSVYIVVVFIILFYFRGCGGSRRVFFLAVMSV